MSKALLQIERAALARISKLAQGLRPLRRPGARRHLHLGLRQTAVGGETVMVAETVRAGYRYDATGAVLRRAKMRLAPAPLDAISVPALAGQRSSSSPAAQCARRQPEAVGHLHTVTGTRCTVEPQPHPQPHPNPNPDPKPSPDQVGHTTGARRALWRAARRTARLNKLPSAQALHGRKQIRIPAPACGSSSDGDEGGGGYLGRPRRRWRRRWRFGGRGLIDLLARPPPSARPPVQVDHHHRRSRWWSRVDPRGCRSAICGDGARWRRARARRRAAHRGARRGGGRRAARCLPPRGMRREASGLGSPRLEAQRQGARSMLPPEAREISPREIAPRWRPRSARRSRTSSTA